jgi:hypothetical protein
VDARARAPAAARARVDLPRGSRGRCRIIVDGTKRARATRAKPGRERLVTDLAANVSKLSGLHQVGVRLELVTA